MNWVAGQNEHFKTTALLGETGTRARIMMLLLWIIGHRLSEDEVGRLLSHTLGDAFRATNSLSVTSATELMQLDSVKPIMVSLRKMIKTKLPLPPGKYLSNTFAYDLLTFSYRPQPVLRRGLQSSRRGQGVTSCRTLGVRAS